MINNTFLDSMYKNKLKFTTKQWLGIFLGAIFISTVIFMFFYRLNDWPAVWWDEGWTLDAARNWITHGHLGQYLDGQPITARSPVRFPVVVPVALSMKLLGVGIWQGRLPGVIFTIFSLCLVVYLCSLIYNKKIGIASLLIMIFLSPIYFNPIIMGRQVLAEMPMLFYLLAGYTMTWLALEQSSIWSVGAVIFFGVSIHAKLQVPPFWVTSNGLAILIAAVYHQRRSIKILAGILLGSIGISIFMLYLQNHFMPGALNDPDMIKILFNSVILVLTLPVRKIALVNLVIYALPQLVGYIWFGNLIIREILTPQIWKFQVIDTSEINKKILSVALWSLGASWLLWYILMALFWTRYLFPPFFIGCIFYAAFVYKISKSFNVKYFIRQTTDLLFGKAFKWINYQAVCMLIIFSLGFGVTIKTTQLYLSTKQPDPGLASSFLQEYVPPDSSVESFESELFFLAPEIRFQFPSDLVSMQLVRRLTIDPSLEIKYNPFESKPEFLVVGPYARTWEPYDKYLSPELFQLVANIGDYQIYKNSKIVTIK